MSIIRPKRLGGVDAFVKGSVDDQGRLITYVPAPQKKNLWRSLRNYFQPPIYRESMPVNPASENHQDWQRQMLTDERGRPYEQNPVKITPIYAWGTEPLRKVTRVISQGEGSDPFQTSVRPLLPDLESPITKGHSGAWYYNPKTLQTDIYLLRQWLSAPPKLSDITATIRAKRYVDQRIRDSRLFL